VEFLRFIFCIGILLCHAAVGIQNVFTNELVKNHFLLMGFVVNFFFMIGGYFLFFQTLKKDLTIRDFIVKKYIRLLPVIVFSMLMILIYRKFGLVSQKFNFRDSFLSLFFIRTMGLYNDAKNFDLFYTNAHLWYIGPFFWTSLLYFSISKSFDRNKTNLLIAIITYVSFLIRLNGVSIVEKSYIFHSIFRSLPHIGLGYFVGLLVHYYNNCRSEKVEITAKDKYNNICRIVMTYVEGFFFLEIFKVLFMKLKTWEFEFYYSMCFAVLLFLFSIKIGWLSRLTNNRIMGFVGRYCYSIYVMQYLVQILLAKGNRLGENKIYLSFVNTHPIVDLVVNFVILEFIVGTIVYHLVERPCYQYLEQKFAFLEAQGNKKTN
jgi:peptidoglycan/LPS O-acetylase OafA/YrhL